MGLEEVDACALGAEVGFESDEDEGGVGAEVEDFGVPLGAGVSVWGFGRAGGGGAYLVHYVLQGVGAVDGEADEEEVGLGVGERTETVVFFLPRRIPKSELNSLA